MGQIHGQIYVALSSVKALRAIERRNVSLRKQQRSQYFSCDIVAGVTAYVTAYVTFMVLWTMAFWLPAGNEWPLQGTAIIGSWFYLPMWILLLIACLRRNRLALLLLLIPVMLFVHDYGRYFTPNWPTFRVATAAPAAELATAPLRVMTWNSYYRNRSPMALVAALDELAPDIVAIQELGYGLQETLADELNERFPYQERFPASGPSGMAFLSRYPIAQSSAPDFGDSACNCQEITIDFHGHDVTVLNTHPWPPHVHFHRGNIWGSLADFTTANQDETFDALLTRIDNRSGPLLVVGDLNTTERQYNYQRVTAKLTDAFAEAGWGMGYTFPTTKRVYGIPVFPILRLDYIFHNEEWQTKRIWRGTIEGSDHQYLVADLLLNDRETVFLGMPQKQRAFDR